MSLHRASSNRFSSTIWPGFVDAMTALLMVLMFVLTIFMIVQSVLREQITDKDTLIADQKQQLGTQGQQLSAQEQRLGDLGQQVAQLAGALTQADDESAAMSRQLAEEQARRQALTADLAETQAEARERAARITRLNADLEARQQQLQQQAQQLDQSASRITDFEAEVAALLAARERADAEATSREAALQDQLATAQRQSSAAELAVAAARAEIDAQAEQARLAAARRDALQALIADLRSRNSGSEAGQAQLQSDLTAAQSALSQAEAAQLAEAEAAQALRDRLQGADSELTAMTLALEESRKQAEKTLTLLAAAEAARDRLTAEAGDTATEAQQQAALLATARQQLADQERLSDEGQRRVALLNEQVASLTGQLGRLQLALDSAGSDQQAAELRVAELGQQLNAALLRTAEERQARLALEQEAREKAEAEAADLARYRSEFFGRLSQILQGRQGVEVVGDRFVFSSEVLFQPGEAVLSQAGRDQIRSVAEMLEGIADEIPPEIDWIIRVDGHTDNLPLSGTGRYRDNWELSQARALAVVRYLIGDLGFPQDRVAATGFADTRPVAAGDTPEARALNRRIELKLTER
ncbi:peptidoglycan -binding protein [Paracoccus sp. M683]|uniref:peptidoglycan -binding protein n=1 Tax=Paracoccus sp. M683 TaxID=2594268 RepID=UPI00117C9522|nr:peptidoglycan -binding protein [Paracoccus sp. M683]TRW95710.1 peptidoglycan -binding protein [Paracoccus sp. M683]